MSRLFGNPVEKFSRDEAHVYKFLPQESPILLDTMCKLGLHLNGDVSMMGILRTIEYFNN